MEVETILRKFGNEAQRRDIEFEELIREYKEKYNVDIEVVTVELQNAFVYDHIVVRVNDAEYEINFNSDGFVTSVRAMSSGKKKEVT